MCKCLLEGALIKERMLIRGGVLIKDRVLIRGGFHQRGCSLERVLIKEGAY